MGTACSRDDNRESTWERRRQREEELNIPSRGGSKKGTPRNTSRSISSASLGAPPGIGALPPPHFDTTQQMVPVYTQPVFTPPIPFENNGTAIPLSTAPLTYNQSIHSYQLPSSGLPPLAPNTNPVKKGPRSRSASANKNFKSCESTPKSDGNASSSSAGPSAYSYGGGSVRKRVRRVSTKGANTPLATATHSSPGTKLRPQIVQALGLLETEEIQQRMDIYSSEKEERVSIASLYHWLPEACAIDAKLNEIIELERMSRVSILRQEKASLDAFVVWVHEILEDARLSMLVSKTLQRQHIPSPHRSARSSYLDSQNDVSTQFLVQPSGHSFVLKGNSQRDDSANDVRSYRDASSLSSKKEFSLHPPEGSYTYYSGGIGAVGPYSTRGNDSHGDIRNSATPYKRVDVDSTFTSPSVHVEEANHRYRASNYRSSTPGDPRFLCYHPPYLADMQQRRAASEERTRKLRKEHESISRLAAQGTLMYNREEEDLKNKIERQRLLAGKTGNIIKYVDTADITATSSAIISDTSPRAPKRAAPPPPTLYSDVSGLNQDVDATGEEHVPWYRTSPSKEVKPHPVGPLYNNSVDPNNYSYVAGSVGRDRSARTGTHSNIAQVKVHVTAMDSSRWRDAREASVRATQARLYALSRD